VGADLARELHAGGAGHRHLRGGVDGEVGREPPDQAADADILDNGGVDARCDDAAEVVGGVREFGGENQGVERDVSPDAAPVEEGHQGR
jgi:hypothetical protein